jgi:hypothetical protein
LQARDIAWYAEVPVGLREELAKLDPLVVRGAIEQALTGDNKSAQVGAVKLLADIDPFGKGTCAACARNAAVDITEARAKLDRLIEREAEQLVVEQTRELTQQLEALRAEHATA